MSTEHGDPVDRLYHAACCLLGTAEGAQELVCGAYTLVLRRRRRQIDPEADLPILLGALRAEFIGSRRFPGSLPESAEDEAELSSSDPADASDVYTQISALPEKLRDAVIAVGVVQLTPAEAHKALGVREATVTKRANEAYALLAANSD